MMHAIFEEIRKANEKLVKAQGTRYISVDCQPSEYYAYLRWATYKGGHKVHGVQFDGGRHDKPTNDYDLVDVVWKERDEEREYYQELLNPRP